MALIISCPGMILASYTVKNGLYRMCAVPLHGTSPMPSSKLIWGRRLTAIVPHSITIAPRTSLKVLSPTPPYKCTYPFTVLPRKV